MTSKPTTRSERTEVRIAARARRSDRAKLRESSFEWLASGYSYQQIAHARKTSVATIRREVEQAIARRRLDAPESFVQLQVARLSKALCVADASLEDGKLRALGPFVKIVAALDRYHGLGAPLRPRPREMLAIAPEPKPAPLALTHAAAPLKIAASIPLEVAEKGA